VRARQIGANRPVPEGDPLTPLARARQLRRRLGDAERLFWSRTRNRRLAGFKIRRQVRIGPFIADFVCTAARLVIELDGDQHAEAADYDVKRTRYLERCGYRVIRFPTRDVLRDTERVLDQVREELELRMRESGLRLR
jgi:adenine-specific DNA-methyltransferase